MVLTPVSFRKDSLNQFCPLCHFDVPVRPLLQNVMLKFIWQNKITTYNLAITLELDKISRNGQQHSFMLFMQFHMRK